MTDQSSTALIQVEQCPLVSFTEKAYMDYSMYVILDRALPHIADGLKPVQRRIVYAMSELGLKATAKYKKSARTVGDVLGKFHPHGDSACYEAMVLMAQPFSYRYPLIDGQGNFGSMDDPKSFAAMRYTESKLTRYSEVLLKELGQGTVDWGPNFDGTLKEPLLLPSRLPNVLLNGSTGIAVGMATDIPPHNLNEVVAACVLLLEHPKSTIEDVCQHILGPDFPTGAEIITPQEVIRKCYEDGVGQVRMRAVFEVDDGEVIITALPYQSSASKILEQIAAQMQAKKLPMIADLRDESDHDCPVRLVIVPRSNRVDIDVMMSHLFATTDLEKGVRINLNMIGTNGRPQVKNILALLKEWLAHRIAVVRRRLNFRLEKVLERLHILDGLLVAFLNIDEVIAIIRSEDQPKPVLMERFSLTDVQAEAILELKLRHLAKLEEMKIRTEQSELEAERDQLQLLLSSDARLKTLVKKELQADAQQFGDERRSPLVERAEASAISEESLIASEPITVVLSQQGWVRAAKGHEIDPTGLNYKSGDAYKASATGTTKQTVIFIDSKGRSYGCPGHSLPSARGQGEPLTSRLAPESGATFEATLLGEEQDQFLLATSAGYGFVTSLGDMATKNKKGKATISITQGATLLKPVRVVSYEDQYIACVSSEGHLLLYPVADLPCLSKGKGNKIIQIPKAAFTAGQSAMTHAAVLSEADTLIVVSGKRHMKLSPAELAPYQGERGRRGVKLPRGFRTVSELLVDVA